MIDFVVIGAPGAAEFLQSGQDLCFGRHYAKSTPECISCRAPCTMDGKVVLMKEVCATVCAGLEKPIKINKLTSQEIMERMERGASYPEIFLEILGKAHPGHAAAAARQLLMDRLLYLKTIGFEAPPVPRTKDLLGGKNNDEKMGDVGSGN